MESTTMTRTTYRGGIQQHQPNHRYEILGSTINPQHTNQDLDFDETI